MNKRTIFGLLSLFLIPTAAGSVTFRIADPNSLLPLSMDEVVLGHPVSLVIYSDANEPWKGGLFIRGQDRELSKLSGRGQPKVRLYQGSCMDGSGAHAKALYWIDSNIEGFDFYTNGVHVSPGDWFVVDYVPQEPGVCGIEFYEYTQEDPNCWDQPRSTLLLENTPSRDFSEDGVVNFEDFAYFALAWLDPTCTDPSWCLQRDLDRSGAVGLTDLLMFSDYWLWGTPGWKPSPGPADPNVIYRITDSLGAAEIEMTVGESITLSIHKQTLEKEVFSIYLEAMISDVTLGWIDNTERDPNNPTGCCSAQILANPRESFFDWWGPGSMQAEAIGFYMVNFEFPIDDGPVASFVYTAAAAGDVTLSLRDYGLLPSSLQGILIHQVDPVLMMSASTGPETTGVPEETPIYTKEETVEFLETIWEEDPQIQQVIDPNQWDTFMEQVKADEEATGTDD